MITINVITIIVIIIVSTTSSRFCNLVLIPPLIIAPTIFNADHITPHTPQ